MLTRKICDSGLHFLRLKTNDPLLNNLFSHMRSKEFHKRKLIAIEGNRFIAEALKCNLKLEALLFSKDEDLQILVKDVTLLPLVSARPIYKVPRYSLRTWSVLETPPGLLAIFHRPMEKQSTDRPNALPITVVCDNVREPNNLGSIIRTCAALPCYEIIMLKGCCDPWNPKSLRGGCGGHFHINIRDNVKWEELSKIISKDFGVFIAENNLAKVQAFPFKNKKRDIILRYDNINNTAIHNVVIIGGETHGVSSDAYRFLDSHSNSRFLYIPLASGIDSLNVASALSLILYELKKYI